MGRTNLAHIFAAALTLATPAASSAAEPPRSSPCFSGKAFPDFANQQLLNRMARGVNLPNWDAEDPEARPDSGTLRALYELGLTHIRLPVYHSAFAAGPTGSADLAAYGAQLLETIDRLTGLGYAVTVDLHPDGTFNSRYRSSPDAGYALLENSWRHLAVLLQDTSPQDVAVEFLNEPDTDPSTWAGDSVALADTLRKLLPHHTFIVGPSGPMRHESFGDLVPLDDRNTIYAFHYYDPFVFTHQGAEWLGPGDPVRLATDVPFPTVEKDPRIAGLVAVLNAEGHREAALEIGRMFETPWTEKDIQEAMDTIRRWSEDHRAPVLVNEFGVLSYHAPRTDRLHWLETVTAEAERRCIGWTHWDYSDGFGIVDSVTNQPDTEELNALLPSAYKNQ